MSAAFSFSGLASVVRASTEALNELCSGGRHEKGLIDAVRRLASTLVEHAGQIFGSFGLE